MLPSALVQVDLDNLEQKIAKAQEEHDLLKQNIEKAKKKERGEYEIDAQELESLRHAEKTLSDLRQARSAAYDRFNLLYKSETEEMAKSLGKSRLMHSRARMKEYPVPLLVLDEDSLVLDGMLHLQGLNATLYSKALFGRTDSEVQDKGSSSRGIAAKGLFRRERGCYRRAFCYSLFDKEQLPCIWNMKQLKKVFMYVFCSCKSLQSLGLDRLANLAHSAGRFENVISAHKIITSVAFLAELVDTDYPHIDLVDQLVRMRIMRGLEASEGRSYRRLGSSAQPIHSDELMYLLTKGSKGTDLEFIELPPRAGPSKQLYEKGWSMSLRDLAVHATAMANQSHGEGSLASTQP